MTLLLLLALVWALNPRLAWRADYHGGAPIRRFTLGRRYASATVDFAETRWTKHVFVTARASRPGRRYTDCVTGSFVRVLPGTPVAAPWFKA